MRRATLKNDPRYRRVSVRGPVTLFVIVLALTATLTVLWHVALVNDYRKLKQLAQGATFHWWFMALGSVLFLAIIVLSSILGAQLIGHVRWRQRQSNFIASVSHELNSPLSAIKLFAQTLRKPDMTVGDRLNFVAKILRDVERLQRLIGNILRAAEVDHRGEALPVAPRRTDLAAYLQDYVDDLAALVAEHDLDVELAAEADCWVMLDPLMFRQVLDNLVDNAVRYSGEAPPRLAIRLARRDGHAEVAFADHGIGVPAKELTSLFDRFYQVAGHHDQGGRRGTGIGLFVVRSIVNAHDGQVEAWSAGPGHGTEIRIRLPRTAAPAPPAAVEPSLADHGAAA
ncbi:MAG TPA: HAMP domain-containing sensor histidine kinase [Thermoanaerobaculia bacterium]|jgi:signal transduction histidine kinase